MSSSKKDQDSDYEDETTISEAIDNEVDQLKSEENSESETSDSWGDYDDNHEYKELEKLQRERIKRIRNQRREMLKELKKEMEKTKNDDTEESKKARFNLLLKQTEIFSNFAPTQKFKKSTTKTSQNKRHTRAKEQEEDEEIIKETLEEEIPLMRVRITESPAFIQNTKLRDYQINGLNWLIQIHDNGVNGILADEMGLGKTLQTIAFLGYLKHVRKMSGPHLIIVPKSVIPNWLNEIAKWCPTLKALKFHGNKEERKDLREKELLPGKFDVCITSYEIATLERGALKKFRWKYLVIDEAHRIKNEKSVLSKCVRLFNTQFRLLLTGTPLQNNLHELWALLNFLLPEVFDSAEDFDSWFNLKGGQQTTDIIDQLHKILKPFMLRRLKTDVETQIPPKKEIYVECGMSKMQKQWYKSLLTKDVMAIKGREKLRLLNIVMQLRKCCNHPYLFEGAEPGPPYTTDMHLIENSGKMTMLDRLLQRLKSMGSRVLIFSQMTRMLDILEDYCYFRKYEYCRIDGQTPAEDRERQMDEYNAPGSKKFIFLLATRAGGLGINLATADTVILYDSDWNPQVDLQAQDRCHRIGQTKPVNVYRLITKGGIEEKIYERAVKKLYLDAIVVQQGRLVEQNKSLSKSELLSMIKFGAEEIFRSDEATITDEALDSILQRGEKKAKEIDNKYKQQCQANLLTFSLVEDSNLYEFEGLDYSVKPTMSIVIERITKDITVSKLREEIGEYDKSVEDIIVSHQKESAILYFKNKNVAKKAKDLLSSKGYKVKFCKKNDFLIQQIEQAAEEGLGGPRRERRLRYGEETKKLIENRRGGPKMPKYFDFQFVDEKRLRELWEKEREFIIKKKQKEKELKKQQAQQAAQAAQQAAQAAQQSNGLPQGVHPFMPNTIPPQMQALLKQFPHQIPPQLQQQLVQKFGQQLMQPHIKPPIIQQGNPVMQQKMPSQAPQNVQLQKTTVQQGFQQQTLPKQQISQPVFTQQSNPLVHNQQIIQQQQLNIPQPFLQPPVKQVKEETGLSPEEQAEKERILAAGFPNWNKKDFNAFIKACEKYGRDQINLIAREVEGKSEQEVKRYADVFWKRYTELADHEKIIKRIKRGEQTIKRINMNNMLVKWKTQQYENPWAEMIFGYGQNKGKQYSEEEDRFLVCCIAQFGYGNWEEVRAEIRRAWEFRFDWFIKSRTTQELQRRIESLIRLIEKEYEEAQGDGKKKRKVAPTDGPGRKKKRKIKK